MKNQDKAVVVVVTAFFVLGIAWALSRNPNPTPLGAKPVSSEYVTAGSHIWSGVKLYYGPEKMYIGDVVSWDEDFRFPDGRQGRAIQLRTPRGSLEWKDREAILFGPWFVRADDPALPK